MGNDNGFHGRQTSPPFIGPLKSTMFGVMGSAARRPLDLPNGPHHVLVASGGRPSVGDNTLECLDVTYDLTGTFDLVPRWS